MNRRRFLGTSLTFLAGAAAFFGCGHIIKPILGVNYAPNPGKVLLIGLDGVRSDALKAANTPNLDLLKSEGAYSYKVDAGYHTLSGSGWSNILTGVWPSKHKVKSNRFEHPNYQRFPGFINRLESMLSEISTYSIAAWSPINTHINTKADQKINHTGDLGRDYLVMRDAVEVLTEEDPDILFIHFDRVDQMGHEFGFHPKVPEYTKEIGIVDGYVGQILTALENRSDYQEENWLVMVTSDHGGIGYRHGGRTWQERNVFLIMHGRDVIGGKIDPSSARKRVEQVDIAPTIYHHLGILIDPYWRLDGRVVGLE